MTPAQSSHRDSNRACPAARFTVVIPTWNEEGWLPALLSRLQAMKRVAQVVVADNQSDDRTRDIAIAEGAQVVDGGTPGRGRNLGVQASSGEFIIFADADVVFTSKALDLAAEHLSGNSNVVAVHFPLRPLGATWFPRCCYKAMDAYFWILGQFGIAQGIGTFLAVRRSAFVKCGGFDKGLAAGEDAEPRPAARRSRRCSIRPNHFRRHVTSAISYRKRFSVRSEDGAVGGPTATWPPCELVALPLEAIPTFFGRIGRP